MLIIITLILRKRKIPNTYRNKNELSYFSQSYFCILCFFFLIFLFLTLFKVTYYAIIPVFF